MPPPGGDDPLVENHCPIGSMGCPAILKMGYLGSPTLEAQEANTMVMLAAPQHWGSWERSKAAHWDGFVSNRI